MPTLFNTIVVFDVYTYAENEADANEAALANVRDGLAPSEQVARDTGRTAVRAAWLNEKPLVGNAVSDQDFERVKGKTCEQVWTGLNQKREQPTISGEIDARAKAKTAAKK